MAFISFTNNIGVIKVYDFSLNSFINMSHKASYGTISTEISSSDNTNLVCFSSSRVLEALLTTISGSSRYLLAMINNFINRKEQNSDVVGQALVCLKKFEKPQFMQFCHNNCS